MNRVNFWSPEAISLLESSGRRDLVDRGDALAERVAALMITAISRLKSYMSDGDLYCGKGGLSLLNNPEAVVEMEHFVNVRLRDEIESLESLLSVFDEIRDRNTSFVHPNDRQKLPSWY